ncbi:MAG: 3-deoxy-manno-octulosonate cytidylyltransferase [Candidatus Helarchaeota archaeon]
MKKEKITVVIPTRYHSTRLEGKILADICGKPMIYHVYHQVKKARKIDEIIVATDDVRIKDAVEKFNGNVIMTSKKHKTGTDRIGEVASNISTDIILNIQGDEPLIQPEVIDQLSDLISTNKKIQMATLVTDNILNDELNNPNDVKVVIDQNNYALFFSRALIPYPRNKKFARYYKHIGVYGYKRDFLLKFIKMKQTPLELAESLEQLRALENGIRIKVGITKYRTIGVDTIEDLEKVRGIIAKSGK